MDLRRFLRLCRTHRRELFTFYRYALPDRLFRRSRPAGGVLLLRLDLIGDCTMFTGAAAALREHYKDRKMTVVCLSVSREIFERMGIFDRILTVDFKPEALRWDRLRALLRELRRERYDILLQPQLSKFPLADILAAAARCNRRISIEPLVEKGNSPPDWVRETMFLYDRFIPYPREAVSEFRQYAAFVRGIVGEDYRITRPSLPCRPQTLVTGRYYVLFPGGSLRQKQWPAERFARLAEHIYRRTGFRGVILGSSGERYIGEELRQAMDPLAAMSVQNLCGQTGMGQVIDIIGGAKFVVSNDTSGVHIACAANVPSVANVGGWHFRRFLPYDIEDIRPGDRLPRVAYVEMPCYGCSWDRDIVARVNPDCLPALVKGEPCLCVDAVSYEQVRELTDRVIDEIEAGGEGS